MILRPRGKVLVHNRVSRALHRKVPNPRRGEDNAVHSCGRYRRRVRRLRGSESDGHPVPGPPQLRRSEHRSANPSNARRRILAHHYRTGAGRRVDRCPSSGLTRRPRVSREPSRSDDPRRSRRGPLAACERQLSTVDIENGQIKDLSPLSGHPLLANIIVPNNQISTVAGLTLTPQSNNTCTRLILTGNPIGPDQLTYECSLSGWYTAWGGANGIAAGSCGNDAPCIKP